MRYDPQARCWEKEGGGRVVVGSFRGQSVAMKQLHSIISSSDYYRDLLSREISA